MGMLIMLPLTPLILFGGACWLWMVARFAFRPREFLKLGMLSFFAAAAQAAVLVFLALSFTVSVLGRGSQATDLGSLAAAMACIVSIPVHMGVARLAAAATTRRKILLAFGGGIVSAVAAGSVVMLTLWPPSDVKIVIRELNLAELPASARDVRCYRYVNLFAGAGRLRFHADPKDIDAFIAGSPGIADTEPEIYSPDHMHLPLSQDSVQTDDKNEYFLPTGLEWFDTTIKVKGRKYEPQRLISDYRGWVIVNDETNTVYVWVFYG